MATVMSGQEDQIWIPSPRVRFWAWFSLGVLLFGAWGGFAVVSLKLPVPIFLFFLAIPLYFYAQWQLGRAIEVDPGLSSVERQEHRRNLWLFGPAGLVQLLIRIYFPSSPLGGRNK